MNLTLAAAVAVLAVPPLAISLGVALLTGGAGAACPSNAVPVVATATNTLPATASTPIPPAATAVNILPGGWDAEQLGNARIIITVGASLGIPPQGQVVALATALQESGLRNLRYGDRDSLGLFQQRPSAGWGTPDQILTPTYAATRFYQALVAVPNWQHLPLTQAADAVQRSAYPLAYAVHEAEALHLYSTLAGTSSAAAAGGIDRLLGNPACLLGAGDGLTLSDTSALPVGYALPVGTPPQIRTAIAWALDQLGTPYSYGGDCTDPHAGNPAHQCDCSSLVQQAYAHASITLPRTTSDQVHAGQPVTSPAALKPGDLVFIPGADGTPTRPGHVGLYIGEGLILHAPHTGALVQLAKVTSWATQIAALRRVQA